MKKKKKGCSANDLQKMKGFKYGMKREREWAVKN